MTRYLPHVHSDRRLHRRAEPSREDPIGVDGTQFHAWHRQADDSN
jgi:hypothetical protein